MRFLFKVFFCLSIVLAIASPFFVVAQTGQYVPPTLPINTSLPIPGGGVPISGAGGQGLSGLVANFYSFAFLIAGFLAFVMIVYGGVRYTFSGGNSSSKEEAKDAIKQALLGLGLLLVAYLILSTINPDLTKLKMPGLAEYVPPPVATSTTPSPSSTLTATCKNGPCVTLGDGYIYKNGKQVDRDMSRVLGCMLNEPGVPAMRITEAMPISSPHQSACHNNGCCVDMTLASEMANDCPGVEAMLRAAQACLATRYLNEYFAPNSICGGRNTEYSTGIHVHIAGC